MKSYNWSSYLVIAMLVLGLVLVPGPATEAQDVVATAGARVGQAVENWRNDLGNRVDDATGGVGDFYTTINELLKKFAAIIAIIVVVALGVLLRYVANLVFFVVVGLLILFGKRNWAVDMRAVIEGLIGLGIIVGSAFAWIAGTRGGLFAGISAGVDAQIYTWILTPIAAFVIRVVFPRRFKVFAEIRELAK